MFDSPAYLRTQSPPVFIDSDGKTHTGQILGADTWLRLHGKLRLSRRDDGKYDPRALNIAMMALINAFFPRAWWKVWKRSVAWYVSQLPLDGRMRALWDFIRSQAIASGMEPAPLPGTTPQTLPTDISSQADLFPGLAISG